MDILRTTCESINVKVKHDASECGLKISCSAQKILELVGECQRVTKEIESFAGRYDFDQQTPYNGYRSFLSIFDSFVVQANKVCANIDDHYGRFFFWKSKNATEIFVISQMMVNLQLIGSSLLEMHKIADNGKLFAKRCHHDNILTRAYSKINQEYFYGRFAGFHMVEHLRNFIKCLTFSMASYADLYNSDQGILSKMFNLSKSGHKYIVDPELCARKVVDTLATCDVHFLSNFMRILDSSVVQKCVDATAKHLAIAESFQIHPEKLRVPSADKTTLINAPIPESQIGIKTVKCRLLSATKREGMIGTTYDCAHMHFADSCDSIILHAHGGGWISQSAKSHEVYLRDWAAKLDVPIVSVDYSLAPEVTFPRAIEEVLYVYCWIMKYGELVGTTGKKIIFAGDSAGGNIMTAVMIRIIEMGLPMPHGIFVAYTPFLLNYVLTPSRFIGFMDPFINVTAIIKIFNCYCNGRPLKGEELSDLPDNVDPNLRSIFCEIDKNYLMSPMWAPDEILEKFPPMRCLSVNTDPCLDDGIEFCRRLKSLKVDTRINVIEGLFHGFLNTVLVCKEAQKGSMKCIELIQDLLQLK